MLNGIIAIVWLCYSSFWCLVRLPYVNYAVKFVHMTVRVIFIFVNGLLVQVRFFLVFAFVCIAICWNLNYGQINLFSISLRGRSKLCDFRLRSVALIVFDCMNDVCYIIMTWFWFCEAVLRSFDLNFGNIHSAVAVIIFYHCYYRI